MTARIRPLKPGLPRLSDEHGFTTAGMALALLIALSLLFASAQVYRVSSLSAEVQDIADAAALAAENQVAEFMVVARFCDALILSMSLTGLCVTGLGIAALCVPATAALSGKLIEAGKSILEARDKFAESAARVLNKLQEALPFFAAACAANVAAANNASGSGYLGVAILVPSSGEAIEIGADGESARLLDEVDQEADEIREQAKRAEEAAKKANEAKQRAFARDCGDNPEYCMYERAGRLAGLSGGENPLYTSVDAWSFSVPLSRARSYYALRLSQEAPADWSVEEQARSALRSHFYRFAVEQLAGGYVHETGESFDANFPHLPSNTSEMRLSELYTDPVYPVTEGEDGPVMHAWMGCPEIAGRSVVAIESIAYLESASLDTCPACGFSAASMGKVAAASTSIPNGFEYHYEAVADAAAVYQVARHEADGPKSEVQDKASGLFAKLAEAARAAADKRIDPQPPGKYGCLAFVVNAGSTPASSRFESAFAAATGTLGPRAAVSAATLVDEGSDEGSSAINAALDNVREDGGVLAGAAGIALDVWSWLLNAYSDGQNAMVDGVERGLDSLPLASASGLGSWAAGKMREAIETVGLQPAKTSALKALVVNSGHVAARSEGDAAGGYLSLKQRIVASPSTSGSLFGAVCSAAEQAALQSIESFGDEIQIASIELIGSGGPSIPITIPVPEQAKKFGASAVAALFDQIAGFAPQTTGVRVWE